MIIGLTGGIGSGKSAVSTCFERLGVDVVDADQVAREVVLPDTPALAEIAAHFGQQIITPQGDLDRAELRRLIFSDKKERAWLESLLHPLIREEIIRQLGESDSPYALLSSPLLLETDQHTMVNRVLVVDVPVEMQIERTITRDNNSREQVEAIIQAQSSRAFKQAQADDIILNTEPLEQLQPTVDTLHHHYLELASHE